MGGAAIIGAILKPHSKLADMLGLGGGIIAGTALSNKINVLF